MYLLKNWIEEFTKKNDFRSFCRWCDFTGKWPLQSVNGLDIYGKNKQRIRHLWKQQTILKYLITYLAIWVKKLAYVLNWKSLYDY